MELRRHLSLKGVFAGLYVLAFVVYIIVGLQPAGATDYVKSAELLIPEIGLVSDVTTLELSDDGLATPDRIVGSYTQAKNKTLLIGHSTAIFQNLNQVKLGNEINYNDKNYKITSIDTIIKNEIDMSELLSAAEKDTIVLMTCAGQLLDHGDATHRLIITALSE